MSAKYDQTNTKALSLFSSDARLIVSARKRTAEEPFSKRNPGVLGMYSSQQLGSETKELFTSENFKTTPNMLSGSNFVSAGLDPFASRMIEMDNDSD